ncbi:MAG: FAD-binding oxidoreductase [Patescibacteria group bacterium]
MKEIKAAIGKFFKGELLDDVSTLTKYSHDASLLEVKPQLVAFPKNVADISNLIIFVNEHKKENPTLSITARSAGTDMSGGPLNESIIVDFTKYINGGIAVNTGSQTATVLPGTFYRDFEVETLKHNLLLPCYPASKNLCAIGGMIANNSAGEKTLVYGKMEDYVLELKVVFSDGKEYTVKPLSHDELNAKMAQNNFEGNIYKKLYDLIEANYEKIKAAKPKVKKNSAGLYLWNVWDRDTGIFDLTKLIVGSQGTLGMVTEVKLKLVPVKKYSKLFVIFLPNLDRVSELVNELLKFKPESLESYDDHTLKMALKFLPGIWKSMNTKHFFKFIWSFLPEMGMVLRGGLPRFVILAEFAGDSLVEIDRTIKEVEAHVKRFNFSTRITTSPEESAKYWTIRRESFNLLRQHVHGSRTAPFIDDIIVDPSYLPEFWPKLMKLLDGYKLVYTVAGHAGSGNFHIIPLMDMKNEKNHKIIIELSEKVYDLVLEYGGSITAEHNDGIIRTPYLPKMFGEEIYNLFKETNKIFDPQDIFNPGKKGSTGIEYLKKHLTYS